MIEAPVNVKEHRNRGVIKITPAGEDIGTSTIFPKDKPKVSGKAKVARPPNAFILYRQHHHSILKAQYPDLHNIQICKFVCLIAQSEKANIF